MNRFIVLLCFISLGTTSISQIWPQIGFNSLNRFLTHASFPIYSDEDPFVSLHWSHDAEQSSFV